MVICIYLLYFRQYLVGGAQFSKAGLNGALPVIYTSKNPKAREASSSSTEDIG